MSPFIIYLLKANGLLVFFWLFYRLFLRKERFYTAIRWYFIGAVLLSLSIPLLTYTKTVIITQEPVFYEIITGNFATEQAYEPSFWETIDGQKVISYLVICISLFFLTKSVVRIIRLYKTIKRSEEHTSELQSRPHLVCRLLLEKKKKKTNNNTE